MAKRKSNLIKREKKMTVYVFDKATADELKEVETLRKLGWIVKPATEKKEEVKVKHIVDEEFNIEYDDVVKEDMVEFIKKYHPEDLKEFAIASHTSSGKKHNGEMIKNKDGKPRYLHISAKNWFYKHYFAETKWVKIEKMLEDRKFKSSEKAKANALENELLGLL